MLITLKNDFHRTEVRVRVQGGSPWKLTLRQSQRVDRELCGMTECRCGGVRGHQDVEIDYDVADRHDDPFVYVLIERDADLVKGRVS